MQRPWKPWTQQKPNYFCSGAAKERGRNIDVNIWSRLGRFVTRSKKKKVGTHLGTWWTQPNLAQSSSAKFRDGSAVNVWPGYRCVHLHLVFNFLFAIEMHSWAANFMTLRPHLPRGAILPFCHFVSTIGALSSPYVLVLIINSTVYPLSTIHLIGFSVEKHSIQVSLLVPSHK